MKGLQLTIEDKQLLIEALLFTSVTDICSEHTSLHRKQMFELAQKLNNPEIKLPNVYIYALDDILEEETKEIKVETVIKNFPNLTIQTSIID